MWLRLSYVFMLLRFHFTNGLEVHRHMSQIYRVDERCYNIFLQSLSLKSLIPLSRCPDPSKISKMEVYECVGRPSAHRENMNNYPAGLGFNSEYLPSGVGYIVVYCSYP